jgi:drug/metabolite transporter (DMT)-like permease
MVWLKSPVLVVIGSQLLFTTGDLIARHNMRQSPFTIATFVSWWFLIYFAVRQVAMFGQLYVFSTLQIGKTLALFSATSLVLANVLGVLLLGEVLSARAYVAVAMVVLAFLVLSLSA